MPRSLAARIRLHGNFTDLGDVAGLAFDLGARDRLNGVDDEQLRGARLDVAEDGGEVGLGGEVEALGQRVDAARPRPDLRRRTPRR